MAAAKSAIAERYASIAAEYTGPTGCCGCCIGGCCCGAYACCCCCGCRCGGAAWRTAAAVAAENPPAAAAGGTGECCARMGGICRPMGGICGSGGSGRPIRGCLVAVAPVGAGPPPFDGAGGCIGMAMRTPPAFAATLPFGSSIPRIAIGIDVGSDESGIEGIGADDSIMAADDIIIGADSTFMPIGICGAPGIGGALAPLEQRLRSPPRMSEVVPLLLLLLASGAMAIGSDVAPPVAIDIALELLDDRLRSPPRTSELDDDASGAICCIEFVIIIDVAITCECGVHPCWPMPIAPPLMLLSGNDADAPMPSVFGCCCCCCGALKNCC